MSFKLGSEKRDKTDFKLSFKKDDASVPGTPVIRKELGDGILAEANNDGSIYLDQSVVPGSEEERTILLHEMRHQTDMKVGKLAYSDDWIKWMGNKYERKDGKIKYDGKWIQEGDKSFPWEQI